MGGRLLAQDPAQKTDELITAYAGLHQFNGSVLVAWQGKVILEKGYGYKNIASNTFNDAHTIFQVGSVTKQFTSTIILKLVEMKKMSLSDKVSKYYPAFPHGDSISIENLLTHTAGIYNYTNDRAFMQTGAVKPSTEREMMALFENKPLDFPPGTKWSYSNSGYSLLGYIIQKVSGMPYEKAVRRYIFEPLHMNASGFDFTDLHNDEKATGYYQLTEKARPVAPIVDSSVSFSAGAIYSTVGDLYKWHEGMEAYRIVPKTLLDKAYTPYKNNYGYGWIIDSVFHRRRIAHSGGIFGFVSNIARIPEDDACIVLLSNSMNTDLQGITQKILAILYHQPYQLPGERKAIALPEDSLKKYVGTYEMEDKSLIGITLENGQLMGKSSNGQVSALWPEKMGFFFIKEVDFQLEFRTDPDGKVNRVLIYHSGDLKTARKIR